MFIFNLQNFLNCKISQNKTKNILIDSETAQHPCLYKHLVIANKLSN